MILPPEHGMVCLTFDDGRYTEWLAQLSLFAEYDAHATFFYNGIPDKAALDSMKQLRSAGHAVGIHTVHHKDADGMTAENGNDYLQNEIFPQLEAMKQAGIEANYFAYPNNARTAYSEQVMGRYFRHCRAGLIPSPEKGFRIADQHHAVSNGTFVETEVIRRTVKPVLSEIYNLVSPEIQLQCPRIGVLMIAEMIPPAANFRNHVTRFRRQIPTGTCHHSA